MNFRKRRVKRLQAEEHAKVPTEEHSEHRELKEGFCD